MVKDRGGGGMKKRLTAVLVLTFVSLMIFFGSVGADMGPKPTIIFDLVYETTEPLEVVEIELFLCEDVDCKDGHLLEKDLGPQNIDCPETGRCESMAYGYAEHQRLMITFSDGVIRESNIFEKKHFDATYKVIVQEDALLVESTGGKLMNPMGMVVGGVFLGTCLVGLLVLGLLVLLALNIVLDWKQKPDSVWLLAVTWVVSVLILALGTWFSWIVAVTAVLEILLGLLYAWRRDLPKLRLATMIVMANTITLMGMLFFSETNTAAYQIGLLAAVEVVIWLVEAAILYLTQRRSLSIKEAALLSLLLNGFTFIVGLAAPF
jgi:hypothetical protein